MGNAHTAQRIGVRAETLQTGDVLLFAEESKEAVVGGQRNWTFCAVVVRNPPLRPPGVHMLYCCLRQRTSETQEVDVRLTPLEEYLTQGSHRAAAVVRRAHYVAGAPSENEVLRLLTDVLDNSKRDEALLQWVESDSQEDHHPDILWSSALTAYALTRFRVLQPDVDWTLVTPEDLATDPLPYEGGARLGDVESVVAGYTYEHEYAHELISR